MRKYNRQEDALWKAAFDGNTARVKAILRKLLPSKNRELVAEALQCAVQNGHAPVVRALLAAGGKADQVTSSGTLMLNAAWQGHLDVVRALIAGGAVFDRRFEGRTAIEAALENNHVEVANYLKKLGARWVMPMLLHACQHGDLAGVKSAIAAGASIHRDYGVFKETALMRAAGGGQVQIVRYLLQQGANPNTRAKGTTALWNAAATSRNVEVIDALVEAGANVNDRGDRDGSTVLMQAALFNGLPVVKRLVELGADVTAKDGTGVNGVLDYARERKNAEVISYLTKLGTRSARSPAHDLAREIARRFGGRPRVVSDGFLFDSKLSGLKCRFWVGGSRCFVEVSNLEFANSEFQPGESAWVIIGRKPERGRGPSRQVEEAGQITGAPVYRSTDKGSIPADVVLHYCKRHRRAFERLRLSEKDELWIGDSFVQLTWSQCVAPRPWDRLKALGAWIQKVARQVNPSSTAEWSD